MDSRRRTCALGFAKLGIDPNPGTPEEFSAIIARDAPRWAEIVRVTGIKLE